MRFLSLLAILALTACTATRSVAPLEYLDEQTAATITVVAQPWIFTRRIASQAEFFNLYAIDVNRMGDHRKYFAVVHYWTGSDLLDDVSLAPTLVLNTGIQELQLRPTGESARELGIAQPLDKSAPSSAQTWLYPVDQAVLHVVSQTRELEAALVTTKVEARYTVWRDGSSELSEFAAAFERELGMQAED